MVTRAIPHPNPLSLFGKDNSFCYMWVSKWWQIFKWTILLHVSWHLVFKYDHISSLYSGTISPVRFVRYFYIYSEQYRLFHCGLKFRATLTDDTAWQLRIFRQRVQGGCVMQEKVTSFYFDRLFYPLWLFKKIWRRMSGAIKTKCRAPWHG